MYFLKCLKLTIFFLIYFKTSKIAVLSKKCLMGHHFYTAYFRMKRVFVTPSKYGLVSVGPVSGA
jgi:hypothetical protein